MRISERLRTWLFNRAISVVMAHQPDIVIGGEDRPYLLRWFITPWSNYDRDTTPASRWEALTRRLPNIYLHRFLRSDDDRALHDHPWASLSVILMGAYVEHTIAAGGVHHRDLRRPGDMVARGAHAAHRVELLHDAAQLDPIWRHAEAMMGLHPVYTLFLTGPRIRNWGFHCRQGWRPHEAFEGTYGTVGRGCE